MNFAYIRVSTSDQNTARQEESLSQYKIDRIFIDKLSGKDTKRPDLELLMQFAREGDCIYCHSLDRLGRSLADLMAIVKTLTDRKVKIVFLKENMAFTGDDSPMAKFCFQIMGALAEMERSIIRERSLEGIAQAKLIPGKYVGRKPKLQSADELRLIERMKVENVTALSREYGLSRNALYKIRDRIESK